MIRRPSHAALAGLLLLPLAANAAGDGPQLWGYGVQGCERFLQAAAAQEAAAGDAAGMEFQRYQDWLTGFISGLSLATGEDVLRGSSIASAMRRNQAYCRDYPNADFFNATMDFVRLLRTLN
ncbi:hypothetical protein F2Q65_02105 [Thiohalocapsa marina]|uniref:Uncharacterized protein n=1 Tax=Thiohalocapsa marina TaxID=424902 RepID=A0A5M8FU43_9GAMM|nr:hypothetical protein [Thiohalocapsa marina]KAA6187338.1 hypothetical protein F2Q65_02105 [Thiohalocapsa marina]